MIEWTTEQRRLADLMPWDRNPRQIKTGQARRLSESFEQFGQVETLAIGPDNEVYNGHQRLNVLRQEHGNGYEVDVRVASRTLSEKEREKLVVYLHRGAIGEFDFDVLANEFELDELLEWGFEEWELGIDPEPEETTDTALQVNRAEELREQWGVETGQLWQLGEHRLICGDCTDADVVAKALQGEVPLLMVTDPPYGVNYDPNWRNEAAEAGLLAYALRRVGEVQNDDRVDWADAYNLFPGDVVYAWSPPGDHIIVTGSVLQACGYQIRNQIMWRKPHFPISRGHYTYQHEPCWYAVKKGKTSHWIGDANSSTVWDINLDANVEGGHSTQKPLECMLRPIANHDSDLVYDPFLGSGTSIIACENLNRKCRAVEISPAYVAVALQRWADHTGRVPVLIDQ